MIIDNGHEAISGLAVDFLVGIVTSIIGSIIVSTAVFPKKIRLNLAGIVLVSIGLISIVVGVLLAYVSLNPLNEIISSIVSGPEQPSSLFSVLSASIVSICFGVVCSALLFSRLVEELGL